MGKNFRNMSQKQERLGEIFETFRGSCKIIQYNSATDIEVKFQQTGYKCFTTYSQLITGKVKDPYYPMVHGVGYLGEGKFSPVKSRKVYDLWSSMLNRCLNDPHYSDVTVCKKWHNLQVFGKDVTSMDNWNSKGFNLDKDLTTLGNKIYKLSKCCFLPKVINTVFNQSRSLYYIQHDIRRVNLPYILYVATGKGRKYYGSFETKEEANLAAVVAKKKYLIPFIQRYKDEIPPKVKKNLEYLICRS